MSGSIPMHIKLDKSLVQALDGEITTAIGSIMQDCQAALDGVAAEAKDALFRHISDDVYKKWSPSEYVRRYEDGGLIDFSITPTITGPASEIRGKKFASVFEMRYKPDGQSEQWRAPADGDALIHRIESGNGYEWGKHPGPRPFWTNFVNEMIDQNQFADSFLRNMALLGETVEGTAEVIRTDGDGDYDY